MHISYILGLVLQEKESLLCLVSDGGLGKVFVYFYCRAQSRKMHGGRSEKT